MLKRKIFFSVRERLIFVTRPFVADGFNFGTKADDD